MFHDAAPTPDPFAAVLRTLGQHGACSRAQLHRETGLRSTTISGVIEAMLAAGLLEEGGTAAAAQRFGGESRGRPAVLLQPRPDGPSVLGLSLRPRRVEVARVNLRGEVVGRPRSRRVSEPRHIARAGATLLEQADADPTLAIGVSSTGLVDEGDMKLLFSSAAPSSPGLSLGPILSVVGSRPIALENDTQAFADRWRLTHPEAASETTLLVQVEDGAVGAAWMPGGQPADAGCVRGANELGHVQVAAGLPDAPRCYCGQRRCVERVFSSAMLSRLSGTRRRLPAALRAWLSDGKRVSEAGGAVEPAIRDALRAMVEGLAEAVAAIVNFTRPHRVVWSTLGPIVPVLGVLARPLEAAVAGRLLPVLRERVRFEAWSCRADAADGGRGVDADAAVTAAHLALAMLHGRRAPASGRLVWPSTSPPVAPKSTARN